MILLSTYTLSKFGLERAFKITKDAGFEGIDISVTDNLDTQDYNYLSELVKEFKLPIRAFQIRSNADQKIISKMVEIAEKMSVKHVIIYPAKFMDFAHAKWIQKMIPLAFKEHKVHLSLLNTQASSILGFIPEYTYSSLIELRKVQNVSLDTSNLVSKKEDLMRTLDLFGKNLQHIYLSNVHNGRDHYFPQEGILPIESFLSKLNDIDYKGDITLKIKGSYLTEDDTDILTMELSKMREYIVKYYS